MHRGGRPWHKDAAPGVVVCEHWVATAKAKTKAKTTAAALPLPLLYYSQWQVTGHGHHNGQRLTCAGAWWELGRVQHSRSLYTVG